MRNTFRSHERLRRSADFLRARRQGRKKVGSCLVIWAFRRPESPARASRFGVSVSRRDGGAVQRNLFKRRMREVFRLNKGNLARGFDFLASPRPGKTSFPPAYALLARDFLDLTASWHGAAPGANA